jgi:hypothetical protein
MELRMIICPRCGGHSPADARFCIECSTPLRLATTNTKRLLNEPPATRAPTPRPARRVSPAAVIIGAVGLALLSTLLLLGYRADGATERDLIAAMLLLIGSFQLVRCTRQGRFVVGLRAAVLCLALVVASVTPWMLTASIIATTTLGALQLSEIVRRSPHRP